MRLAGSIPALVTPFQRSGALDLVAFSSLVDWHLAQGSSGVVVAGSTGESGALETAEVASLIAVAVERCKGRVPVIAGAGGSSTAQAMKLVKLAGDLGADAVLATTPHYCRPTQAGLHAHYVALAEVSRVPMVLYNVPGRTGVDLLPKTVAELARLPQVIAIKEAVAEESRMLELLQLRSERFAVLSGDDPTALRSLLAGADGVISVVANLVPSAFAALCRLANESQLQAAGTIDAMLAPLYAAAALEPNPIPVKAGLSMMGRIEDVLRLPLQALASEHHAAVRTALAACAAVGVVDLAA